MVTTRSEDLNHFPTASGQSSNGAMEGTKSDTGQTRRQKVEDELKTAQTAPSMSLISGSASTSSSNHINGGDPAHGGTNIFDLPQEVRDMIFSHFPYLASIHINQDPDIVRQPAISQTCRQLRKESLDIFYGRNKFFLDLRGWKSIAYPRPWTPRNIFDSWITAIGDENAARLRSLSFYSHNFNIRIRISTERPPSLSLKLVPFLSRTEVAEGLPSSYTFKTAARRAEQGLQLLIEDLQSNMSKNGLDAEGVKKICWAVDSIQPFLCRRVNLGYQGAVLLEEDAPIERWPSTKAHLDKCDDCDYHRFTRGTE